MSNTVNAVAKELCTGCGLCAQKCPKGCIAMKPDAEGFLFPEIDTSACIDCGLCIRFCPTTSIANTLYHEEEQEYFCSIAQDKATLLKSSSGGIFSLLSNQILNEGGYVCGCIYDENMQAVHTVTNSPDTVLNMYGSKYVQSRAYHCFPTIKQLLEEKNTVLFTGTACQIAACRLFLGKDVQFRNKEKHGWGSEHRTCVLYEKRGKIKKHRPFLPAYFSAFFYGLNLRESCYRCRFADKKRVADLTIGDFWGSWAKYGKRFDEGISVASVNTAKGAFLKEKIQSGSIFFEQLTRNEAVKSNDNFEHPIPRPKERTAFYSRSLLKTYRGAWKKAYFSRTYRKKTLASLYGAIVPAKIRFALQRRKRKKASRSQRQ